eukprot:15439425-Alexandrium_andersonii.AAC.1
MLPLPPRDRACSLGARLTATKASAHSDPSRRGPTSPAASPSRTAQRDAGPLRTSIPMGSTERRG